MTTQRTDIDIGFRANTDALRRAAEEIRKLQDALDSVSRPGRGNRGGRGGAPGNIRPGNPGGVLGPSGVLNSGGGSLGGFGGGRIGGGLLNGMGGRLLGGLGGGSMVGLGLGALGVTAGIAGLVGKTISLSKEYFMAINSIVKASDMGADGVETFGEAISRTANNLRIGQVELLRFEKAYMQIAGIQGGADRMSKQVATAGGFARGYGLEVGQTAHQFAGLAQTGVFGLNARRTTREFAGLLADSINRGGMRGRENELISSIQSLVNTQLTTLAKPSGMASMMNMLTAMNASGNPAMMGMRGAGFLSQLNSGLQNPRGELGELMMWQAIGGKGMGYEDFRYKQEDGLKNLPAVMKQLRKASRGDHRKMTFLASEMLGVSQHHIEAYLEATKNSGNGNAFVNALSGAGVLETSNPEMLGVMSQVFGAGNDKKKIAEILTQSGKFSSDSVKRISEKGDMTGILQAMSLSSMEQTTADKFDSSFSKVENALTDLGKEIVPTMADGFKKVTDQLQELIDFFKKDERAARTKEITKTLENAAKEKLGKDKYDKAVTDGEMPLWRKTMLGSEGANSGLEVDPAAQTMFFINIDPKLRNKVNVSTGTSPANKVMGPQDIDFPDIIE